MYVVLAPQYGGNLQIPNRHFTRLEMFSARKGKYFNHVIYQEKAAIFLKARVQRLSY